MADLPDPEPSDPIDTDIDPAIARRPRIRYEPMPSWVPRAIVLFFVGVVAVIVLGWLLARLRPLLVILLVSLFVSFALEPAVNWMERRGIRRGLGTAIAFLGVLAAFSVFAFFMGRLFVEQVAALIERMPDYIIQVQDWANRTFNLELDVDELIAEFQTGGRADQLAGQLASNIVEISGAIVGTVFQLLTVTLFTFYLVADGPKLRRTICSALPPQRQREVLRVWEIAIDKTGGYIYSRVLLATISGVTHWVAFEIIDLPFALPLALWVGVMSQFIPVVGTYLAGALPMLIAVLDDPITAVWVLVIVVVYQQIENYILLPRVSAHTMQLHAAVAFGAVIAGAAMLGVVGALLALPAAATVQAFVSTYLSQHEVIESSLTQQKRSPRRGPILRRRRREDDDAGPAAPDPASV
jgi:predicted PurR-regulated permease PerM